MTNQTNQTLPTAGLVYDAESGTDPAGRLWVVSGGKRIAWIPAKSIGQNVTRDGATMTVTLNAGDGKGPDGHGVRLVGGYPGEDPDPPAPHGRLFVVAASYEQAKGAANRCLPNHPELHAGRVRYAVSERALLGVLFADTDTILVVGPEPPWLSLGLAKSPTAPKVVYR